VVEVDKSKCGNCTFTFEPPFGECGHLQILVTVSEAQGYIQNLYAVTFPTWTGSFRHKNAKIVQ